jgi:hypothetical protein
MGADVKVGGAAAVVAVAVWPKSTVTSGAKVGVAVGVVRGLTAVVGSPVAVSASGGVSVIEGSGSASAGPKFKPETPNKMRLITSSTRLQTKFT